MDVFQIVPLLFIIVAAWMFGREILALRRSKQSESWPFTEGEVVSSNVKSRHDSDGDTSYSAAVRYEYEVNGTTYVSRTISFGRKLYFGRASAEDVAAMYPVGEKVTVYYDPNNHKIATLEPGISVSSFIVLGLSAVFFIVGLWFLLSIP
jgi:hypothetical protein